MNEQDRRAVEGLARSGIGFEDLCDAFPKFDINEIQKIYMDIQKIIKPNNTIPVSNRKK